MKDQDMKNGNDMRYKRHGAWLSLALAPCLVPALQAQGILAVTPGASISGVAGTGTSGFSGDGAPATAAKLFSPSAVALDASGNTYIADARNHVIRKVAADGTISTIAGTGTPGFSGDGAAATSAQLDTPGGVAVDANGIVYVADSKNNRIRYIASGTINTLAGAGAVGATGDGGAFLNATFALPSAVLLSTDGASVYVADTNNHRVRRLYNGIVTTVAGNGIADFAGDGGAATAASLDSPVALALDGSGNLYIADRHNQRIRKVSGGVISTVAGNGGGFAGGSSGDGGSATAALLARPSGIAFDSLGNLYIADANNQRVRKVSGTTIGTAAGNGVLGRATGPALLSALNSPAGLAVDANDNLYLADKLENRVVESALGMVNFGGQVVNTASSAMPVVLTNNGGSSLTVSGVAVSGPFAVVAGGSCSATPITVPSFSSCTVNVAFTPVALGAVTGKTVVSVSGAATGEVLLTGSGVNVTATKLIYTAAPASPITAGDNAGTVSVALEDTSGNIATTDSSTQVTLAVTSAGGYSQMYSATVASGVASFNLSSVALTTSGTYTYTATSGSLTQATATETVNAGAAFSLTVFGQTLFNAPQISGTETVTARDGYGNVATGFRGTVTLSSTDASAAYSPNGYTFTATDNGVHAFTATFNAAGIQSLTATSGGLFGSLSNIVVRDAIWLVNTNDALTRFTNAGAQTGSYVTAAGPSSAGGVAFDAAGNVWATQRDENGYVKLTPTGAASSSGVGTGGLNGPVAVAIDGAGQAWFANANNSTITVLGPTGAAVSPATGYTGVTTAQTGGAAAYLGPAGITVDVSGNVWVTNAAANALTEVLGAAVPLVAPSAQAVSDGTVGTRP